MSYSVDLELDQLYCVSNEACLLACYRIIVDPWMRHHLEVTPSNEVGPAPVGAWHIAITAFDGCDWNEPAARSVWLAIAPFMADGAKLEFREEGGFRYRVHWQLGRAILESPVQVIWGDPFEITEQNVGD